MKNLSRLICTIGLLGIALPSQAVKMHAFPGLDGLIKQADVIAVVQITSADQRGQDFWTSSRCYVQQTLKGHLSTDEAGQATLDLNPVFALPSGTGGHPLAPYSTHLVFLHRWPQPVGKPRYTVITCPGADLPLAPQSGSKFVGRPLKAQIQALVREYKFYRDKRIKQQDRFFNEVLARK